MSNEDVNPGRPEVQHLLATIALAPLLILQGRRVRRVTPVLPEPPGPRSGCLGSGPELRLLVAGDSAAAGVGASVQSEAVTGQLVRRLSEAHRVDWRLLARTGMAIAELRQMLAETPPLEIDVAIISIGVNDVTGRTTLANWRRDLQAVAGLLRTRHQAQRQIFTSLPPMHHFPSLPQPLRWYLGARARQLDREMLETLAGEPGCEVLRLDTPFESRFMAQDGFHPGEPAHAEWARMAAHLIVSVGQENRCP